MFKNYDIKAVKLLKSAEEEKQKLKHEYVGTEHMLLAILKENNNLTKDLLKFNLNYKNFKEEIIQSVEPTKKEKNTNIYTPLLKRVIKKSLESENINENVFLYNILNEGEGVAIRLLINMNIDVDAIYNYLKNNTFENENLEVYKIGKVLNNYININENVIGRDKEINLIIETLLRKKKNNPLLIGDAGVGKSAIVEQLTRKIMKGEVPDQLLDCKIVMLEMSSLVAGTRYRGEFEDKLNNIINEVINHKNIILFIDEIHSMVNAGAAEGAISASDILKPYLARGDIKCIGATTKKEYEKYFLVDKALSRRFETIIVNEPDEQETFNILKNVKNEYEKFHKVSIKDDTIKILIHLASTYYPNKKNPDKSLELLDSIMSYVKLKTKNNLIKEKELELKRIGINKIKEIENGNFKEALNNNMLENKIKKELNLIKNTNKVFVKDEDLIDVLEYKNNIIISKNKVNIINNRLSKKYSNKIIDLITKTIYKKEGIKSFMFVGQVNDLINDLSKELNYNIIKLSDEKSFENMILKVKYNMGCILLINDNTNNIVKKQIAKIVKDKLYEYNDEYINFNNVIVINNTNKKSVGFENSIISSIPVDEIIILKKVLN